MTTTTCAPNHTNVSKKYRVHVSGLIQWQAYRFLDAQLSKALATHHISAPEWKTLGIICDEGSIGSLDLSSKLMVRAALVTRIVTSLVEKKLVTSSVSEKDGRARVIMATPHGLRTLSSLEPVVREYLQPLLQGLKAGSMESYMETLSQIVANGRRSAQAGERTEERVFGP